MNITGKEGRAVADKSGRIGPLDGIRAVAVLMVVWYSVFFYLMQEICSGREKTLRPDSFTAKGRLALCPRIMYRF